jgi:endonuclease/exonuclease/phosphatase family metal-dependent hydrolase
VRVLTWNLFHGRAVPPAGRSLLSAFAETLAAWEWDVALLQEVPPWWPDSLGAASGAEQRTALTSRNFCLPVRRWIADRWPDVIKSNGGGSNAILVRGVAITDHRSLRLTWWPERRLVHAVRLDDGIWVANLHATVHNAPRAEGEARRAGATVLAWAGDAAAVLGGDFNTPSPSVNGFQWMGGHGVDHVLARGFDNTGPGVRPARGELSDHAPVLVELVGPPSAEVR